MKKLTLVATALSLVISSSLAQAKVSEAEAAKLGTELMPLGGEKSANADGSIPAWNGGITEPPAGYSVGDHHPDPYPGDKVLFEITASNMAEHAELLSEGQKKLFETYPDTFKIPVYESHQHQSLSMKLPKKMRPAQSW